MTRLSVLAFSVALAACSESRVTLDCGEGGRGAQSGVAVFCAYGIVIGGIRPCPNNLPNSFEIPNGAGQLMRVCSNQTTLPGLGVCSELGLRCDIARVSDAGAVQRFCPTAFPTIRQSCTVPALTYCIYQCSGDIRRAAFCDGLWNGDSVGGEVASCQPVEEGHVVRSCPPGTPAGGPCPDLITEYRCPIERPVAGAVCREHPSGQTCNFPCGDGADTAVCTENGWIVTRSGSGC